MIIIYPQLWSYILLFKMIYRLSLKQKEAREDTVLELGEEAVDHLEEEDEAYGQTSEDSYFEGDNSNVILNQKSVSWDNTVYVQEFDKGVYPFHFPSYACGWEGPGETCLDLFIKNGVHSSKQARFLKKIRKRVCVWIRYLAPKNVMKAG